MANVVTLQQAKTYLRYPNPTQPAADDTALQWVINAADDVIEFECDDVLPHAYDEYYDGGDTQIWLRNTPLLSVQAVEEGWGYLNYELDYQEANAPGPFSMFAYSVDGHEFGKITRRTAGNVVIPFRAGSDNIHVQYTTGLPVIAGAIFMAELELIAHWWQNSQLRSVALAGTNVAYDSVAGAVYTRDTEAGTQNINIGVPYRILEQLKAFRHRPIIA